MLFFDFIDNKKRCFCGTKGDSTLLESYLAGIKDFGLVILSLCTVLYARKTYLATNTPRIIVKSTKYSSTRDKGDTLVFHIKNFGKGIAVKTYLILEYKDGSEVTNYLSKPEVTIETDEEREIRFNFTEDGILDFKNLTGFIFSQDFSGGFYYVKLDLSQSFSNQHLKEFDKSVRPINRFANPLKFRKMKTSMKRAIEQRNTYVDVVERAHEKLHSAINDEQFLKQLEQLEKDSKTI